MDKLTLSSAQEIENHLKCHPVIARILWNRGFHTSEAIDNLFHPHLSHLPDPFSIIDMEKGVYKVAQALIEKKKIAVYGDYDVDGTCGASILINFLKQLGANVTCYQPDRFKEGYGVHVSAIQKLISQESAQCIITVDCGITAVEPANLALGAGVPFIILDHHQLGKILPHATAVINPQRPQDTSGLKNLCGAGLAFFFVMGLRAYLRKKDYFKDRAEPNLLKLLDLVAIATVADMVDIRGVNRILVSNGLKLMAHGPRPGVQALLEAAGISKPQTMHCGFILGPRINAAGRLKSARSAFELLTSEDLSFARTLASQLEQINSQRRNFQEKVFSQARLQALKFLENPLWKELSKEIPASAFGSWPRVLVLANESWHEGVLGIVATKITQEFDRPTIILSESEQSPGVFKGSVRSLAKIDILSVISAQSVANYLLNFGGHAHAGGVSLSKEKLEDFTKAINIHAALTLTQEHYQKEMHFDAEAFLHEIDTRFMEELKMLEPFGQNFPEPVLKLKSAEITQMQFMKEKHVKFKLKGFDAVWFNAISTARPLSHFHQFNHNKSCSLWVSPQWNEWRGMRKLQLRIMHVE